MKKMQKLFDPQPQKFQPPPPHFEKFNSTAGQPHIERKACHSIFAGKFVFFFFFFKAPFTRVKKF